MAEAQDKAPVQPGKVFFAPPNYHLLVEDDRSFALSIDARVNFTRPSIDVLFESAADVFGRQLAGVILSGANQDGARGLRAIRERGGLAIVQDPDSAASSYMPQAALEIAGADYVLPPGQIGRLLQAFGAPEISAAAVVAGLVGASSLPAASPSSTGALPSPLARDNSPEETG